MNNNLPTDSVPKGIFFSKKKYRDTPCLTYSQAKQYLPEPMVEAKPQWADCYNFAVELLYQNIHVPTENSGFVSNFVDAAFNEDIFLWDTAFMTMFCNLFHDYIPGIRSLDNFYCKQMDDGEIAREMVRETGRDLPLWVNREQKPLYSYFHNDYGHRRLKEMTDLSYENMYKPPLGRTPKSLPYYTLDNLNHPILAWAEWISYCHTGDVDRLDQVYLPLWNYYQALREHIRHENGLYVTDWASMDNSPRNQYLGCGVDISCEMVLFAKNLLDIITVLEQAGLDEDYHQEHRSQLTTESAELTDTINRLMWNEDDGFYYDLSFDGRQAPIKTIAPYWALISGVADRKQAERLAAWLEDTDTFNRPHRVPVLAADEPGYDPKGGYWSGSVWAPTNTMVIKGLEAEAEAEAETEAETEAEAYGYRNLARDIALNHLEAVCAVFEQTGSIWENYPADEISSGNADKKDFVGWSGLAPILYLIEYGVGLQADVTRQSVTWHIDDELAGQGTLGCKRYWFFGKQADFYARPDGDVLNITIDTNDTFMLNIEYKDSHITKQIQGTVSFQIP